MRAEKAPARSIEEYPTGKKIFTAVLLPVMGVCIGLVSLFVCGILDTDLGWTMFLSYLHEPLILALNLIPCVLLVWLFFFLTGRVWPAFVFPAALVFALSAINYYKIRIRSETFLVSDVAIAGEAAGIISRYKLELSGRILLMIGALAFGTLFTVLLLRGKWKNRRARLICAAVTLAAIAALGVTVYRSTDVYYNKAVNKTAEINVWSDLQVYVSKGFLYPFAYSAKSAFPEAPEGYSEARAKAILAPYEDADIPADKRVNIISVMLEAYTDLSEHPQVPVHDDVYAPLHALYPECVHGHIVANVFGGGTVNTERNFLTGYAQAEEYRKNTNSHLWYLRSQGYYVEGYHAGDSWFYNRKNVEYNLGMERFGFLDDYTDASRFDSSFFGILTDLYADRDKSVPYFNYSITYQNHGAYSATGSPDASYLDKGSLSDASYHILNNYFHGIADTSQRMRDFIDSLRDDEAPVIVVFFGDHMPWLGDGNSVYHELGINIDLGTEEGFFHYYTTPYLIWANDAAKAVTGSDFTGDGGAISACFLMNRIFALCGWKGSAWMQFNADTLARADILNTGNSLYRVDGELISGYLLEDDQKDVVWNHKIAEYYYKRHFLYQEQVR